MSGEACMGQPHQKQHLRSSSTDRCGGLSAPAASQDSTYVPNRKTSLPPDRTPLQCRALRLKSSRQLSPGLTLFGSSDLLFRKLAPLLPAQCLPCLAPTRAEWVVRTCLASQVCRLFRGLWASPALQPDQPVTASFLCPRGNLGTGRFPHISHRQLSSLSPVFALPPASPYLHRA